MDENWQTRFDKAVRVANEMSDAHQAAWEHMNSLLSTNVNGQVDRWLTSAELDTWADARKSMVSAHDAVAKLLAERVSQVHR